MDLEGFEPLTSRMRTERSPMLTLKKPPKDKTFLLKNGKKHRVMRVFGRALLSRKNCHFCFNVKKSHFRRNALQMRFERATI